MYLSLAPIWQSLIRNNHPLIPLAPGDYTVIADLVLDTEGKLLGVEFKETSGVSQFNEAVIASAQKVRKFPNPPRDLINDNKEVRTLWSFTVNVGENSFLNIAPPRRIQ